MENLLIFKAIRFGIKNSFKNIGLILSAGIFYSIVTIGLELAIATILKIANPQETFIKIYTSCSLNLISSLSSFSPISIGVFFIGLILFLALKLSISFGLHKLCLNIYDNKKTADEDYFYNFKNILSKSIFSSLALILLYYATNPLVLFAILKPFAKNTFELIIILLFSSAIYMKLIYLPFFIADKNVSFKNAVIMSFKTKYSFIASFIISLLYNITSIYIVFGKKNSIIYYSPILAIIMTYLVSIILPITTVYLYRKSVKEEIVN